METIHSGWLWKEGARGGFRKRWFTLEVGELEECGAVLRYYHSIDDQAPKNSIPLKPGGFRLRTPKSPRKDFSATLRLEITCDPRPKTCRAKYILASSSDADLDGWRAALRCVATHGDSSHRVPGSGTSSRAGRTDPSRPLLVGDRDRCVQMAVVCGQASRYDDMAAHVLQLAAARAELSATEEGLMSEAFARVAWERRSAWRALCAAEYAQEHATRGRFADRASVLRVEAEEALVVHCRQVITALEGLIPSASRPVSRILYLLLLADHHRYMAEITRGDGRLAHTKHSLTTYQAAAATAGPAISTSHTVALRLALGHATLVAELLGDYARGATMARDAFDKALAAEIAETTPNPHADDESTGNNLEERMGAMQLLVSAADTWSAVAEELSDGSGESSDEGG
jgi:hypothetical protein